MAIFSCSEVKEKTEKPKPTTPKDIKADVYIVASQTLSQDIEVAGSLLAAEEVELHPEISGRVTDVLFKEGGNVSQGSVLLKLYDADLQAQLQKLLVQLATAEQTAGRFAALLKINGVSQQEYDLNVLAVNNIKSDINIVRTNISKTSLRAPFSGKVGITPISKGAYVTPQTVITSLRRLTQLKLEFAVPEKYGQSMKNGNGVQFTVENNTSVFDAKIIATENTIAEDTRSLKVKALVKKKDSSMIAGGFIKVKIPLGKNDSALMIPTQAIIPRARGKEIVVLKNGKASMIPVITGYRGTTQVEITEGIKSGDTVLLTGLLSIKQGNKVKINKIIKN
jgi:membrane fusion protein (multidrug efflux system)